MKTLKLMLAAGLLSGGALAASGKEELAAGKRGAEKDREREGCLGHVAKGVKKMLKGLPEGRK